MLATLSFCFERSGCSVVDTEPSRSRTSRCVGSCPFSGARSGVRACAQAIPPLRGRNRLDSWRTSADPRRYVRVLVLLGLES
jgi:hypothetical protein